MHEHTEAVVGLPPEQVKFRLDPRQELKHPPKPPSSHTSFPTTFPSPQIGRHNDPESKNPL